jgi:hypothetical protein
MTTLRLNQLVPGNVYKSDGFIPGFPLTNHNFVYIGGGQKIHISGESFGTGSTITLSIATQQETFYDHPANHSSSRFTQERVIARARKAYNDSQNGNWVWTYSLLKGNCEHFAMMCLIGEMRSFQIEQMNSVKYAASYTAHALWETGSLPWRLAKRALGYRFINMEEDEYLKLISGI